MIAKKKEENMFSMTISPLSTFDNALNYLFRKSFFSDQ